MHWDAIWTTRYDSSPFRDPRGFDRRPQEITVEHALLWAQRPDAGPASTVWAHAKAAPPRATTTTRGSLNMIAFPFAAGAHGQVINVCRAGLLEPGFSDLPSSSATNAATLARVNCHPS